MSLFREFRVDSPDTWSISGNINNYLGDVILANRKKKTSETGTVLKGLVTVAFAEDVDLATHYKELLNDNDIPAAIKTRPNPELPFQGVAVMVPEDHLDEAHVIIANQSSMGDFYDLAFSEDDYEDTDKEFYDKEDKF